MNTPEYIMNDQNAPYMDKIAFKMTQMVTPSQKNINGVDSSGKEKKASDATKQFQKPFKVYNDDIIKGIQEKIDHVER